MTFFEFVGHIKSNIGGPLASDSLYAIFVNRSVLYSHCKEGRLQIRQVDLLAMLMNHGCRILSHMVKLS